MGGSGQEVEAEAAAVMLEEDADLVDLVESEASKTYTARRRVVFLSV